MMNRTHANGTEFDSKDENKFELLQFTGMKDREEDEKFTKGSFCESLIAGLRCAGEAKIHLKYLYDEKGSRIFESICGTPEYYITRTELELLDCFSGDLLNLVGPDSVIIEPGAGALTKIRVLIKALKPAAYMPMDISGTHLMKSAQTLSEEFPNTTILVTEGDFTRAFTAKLPMELKENRRVMYFPGSTIGNFQPAQASELLASFASPLREMDMIILGWDRFKDSSVLNAAYNDAQGYTEGFFLNLLDRCRKEVGATIDGDAFAMWSRFQPEHERVKMGFRSVKPHTIVVPQDARTHRFEFEEGQELFIEYSHKWKDSTMDSILAGAGLKVTKTFTDPKQLFAISVIQKIRIPVEGNGHKSKKRKL